MRRLYQQRALVRERGDVIGFKGKESVKLFRTGKKLT